MQTPPPPPRPPLPHQRFWRWFRSRSTRVQIIISIVLILSCSLCTYVSFAASSSPLVQIAATPIPTNTPTQTATATDTPTVVPTVAATDTPTPQPSPTATQPPTATPTQSGLAATHGTPQLGGPLSDFVGAYGQPNSNGTPGAVYHFLTVGNIDTLIVGTTFGITHVDNLLVSAPNGNAWSPTEATNRCMTFAPSDAQRKQRFYYADNSGYDIVYSSAKLVHDFPAADFVDNQQNQTQPGTFDVSYLYKSSGDSQHITGCDMIIGEQQTTN